jgi:Spy/CpxP family protein refolding chaperone
MKNKIILLLAAGALTVGGITTTKLFAAEKSDPSLARGRVLQRLAEKLDLTEAQRTQIHNLIAGEKAVLQPLLNRLHAARKDLRETIHADQANESSVRAAAAKVAAVEADLAVERRKLYGKIAPVLTDEQRQKLAELEQRADEFIDRLISGLGAGQDN